MNGIRLSGIIEKSVILLDEVPDSMPTELLWELCLLYKNKRQEKKYPGIFPKYVFKTNFEKNFYG